MAVIKTGASSYAATCDNCGASIQNIYQVGDKVYGSECIKKMTGQKPRHEQSIWVEKWQVYQDYLKRIQATEVLDY